MAQEYQEGSVRRWETSDDDYMDDRGWSPLHISAWKGDLDEVERLLNGGMGVNVAAWGPRSLGITPLHLAAQGGHLKVMKKLLESGANIDARSKMGFFGWTPLHNAAKERKKKAMKFLIKNGAFLPDDINDARFNPPLYYCPGLEWAYEEMKRIKQAMKLEDAFLMMNLD